MSTANLAIHADTSNVAALVRPEPRSPITVRLATERDLPFIDALMKKHGKAVAFASTQELRSHITEKMALIAEANVETSKRPNVQSEGTTRAADAVDVSTFGRLDVSRTPIGYCLYRDRYMKREDCGIVSQLVVDANKHRGLVGAALIQAMFERVPYGVRLFCCWCAQDLEANRFWEAIGFVPLAFRAGARGKEHGGTRREGTRLHIFWQRRVREGDDYAYWFPSQSSGGRSRENRISLPIPVGKHWSDELPLVLPGEGGGSPALRAGSESETSGSESRGTKRKPKPKAAGGARPVPLSVSNGLRFGPAASAVEVKPIAPPKPKRVKQKNDPKYIAAARELRDRYLEQMSAGLILPGGGGVARYDVSRALQVAPTTVERTRPPELLMAA